MTGQEKGKAGQSPAWQYFGMHRNGSYAEFAAVPESSLVKLPDNVSYEDAACLPVAGLTAYHAVKTVGDVHKGDSFSSGEEQAVWVSSQSRLRRI